MEIILLKKVGHLGETGREGLCARRLWAKLSDSFRLGGAGNRGQYEGLRGAPRRVGEGCGGELWPGPSPGVEQLEGLTVTVARKAGDEGKLFGSVGTQDIAAAVQEMGAKLEKQEVRLPEGPFRAAGEYEVSLHLHADVDATIKLEVIPEE